MESDTFLTINSKNGPIKGVQKTSVLNRDYYSFQSIPYMKPPLGKLRFRDPQPCDEWIEPFDACHDALSYCYYHKQKSQKGGQEDAGVLNVFVPVNSSHSLLPVMVYIHGGGFQMGSCKTDVYGPDYFMQKDVVLVVMNYRLGPIGFLSLDDASLGVPGNAGLKDQTLALRWIQNNISSFGGDPNNITLFGDGAGGASTHFHMISEQSKGLFHKAIIMSGCAYNKTWALPPKKNFAQRLGKKLGWDESGGEKKLLEVLEGADPFDLMQHSSPSTILTDEEFAEFYIYGFCPVVEPYLTATTFIEKDVFFTSRQPWSKDINCIIGAASVEGAFAAIFEKKEILIEFFEKSNYFSPLRELNLSIDDVEAARFGTRIKKIYFEYAHLTNTNYELFCKYSTDRHFWHGIQNTVKSRVNGDGEGKTYLYRFHADTELNAMKKFNKLENFSGATHGDSVFYIFASAFVAPPTRESKEYEMMTKTIALITNFASNGNPNDSELREWIPVTSVKPPLQCLNISEKKIEMISLPESDRLLIWDTIYKDAKVEMY